MTYLDYSQSRTTMVTCSAVPVFSREQTGWHAGAGEPDAERPTRPLSLRHFTPISTGFTPLFLLSKTTQSGQEAGAAVILRIWSVVEPRYDFRRPPEVSSFLQAHPFLLPLLVEAHEKVTEYFEPSTKPILEAITDPEAEDSQELFVLIPTHDTPEEALSRLDRLDQEWWLDVLPQARGKMTIDVEYR